MVIHRRSVFCFLLAFSAILSGTRLAGALEPRMFFQPPVNLGPVANGLYDDSRARHFVGRFLAGNLAPNAGATASGDSRTSARPSGPAFHVFLGQPISLFQEMIR